MQMSRRALVTLRDAEASHRAPALLVDVELQPHPLRIILAAGEAVVAQARRLLDRVPMTRSFRWHLPQHNRNSRLCKKPRPTGVRISRASVRTSKVDEAVISGDALRPICRAAPRSLWLPTNPVCVPPPPTSGRASLSVAPR